MGCLDLVFGENHLLMKDGVGKKTTANQTSSKKKKDQTGQSHSDI